MSDHIYHIVYPNAVSEEFKHFRYKLGNNIYITDVFLAMGKEPKDHIKNVSDDIERISELVGMQIGWPSIKEKTREAFIPTCAKCGVQRPEKLKSCGACMKVLVDVTYCSIECQTADWKNHKQVCMKHAPFSTVQELRTSGLLIKHAV